MHARVTTLHGQPDRLDQAIEVYHELTLPALQKLAGFQTAYLLIDREHGKALAVVLWESEEAMLESEPEGERLRGQAAEQFGAPAPTVERYEVVAQS